jgi:hypothetical protein
MHPCLLLRRLNPLGVALLIIVIATAAYLHEPAQQGNGKGLLLLFDELLSQFDSLAKKAVAS